MILRNLPAVLSAAVVLGSASFASSQDDPIARARSLIESERYVEALSVSQTAAQASPNDYRAHYYVAMAYLGSQQFVQAEAAARIALSKAPTEARSTIEGLINAIAERRSEGLVQSAARLPGDVFQDCLRCPSMVVVPAGSFMMGSPASEQGRSSIEGPMHLVTLPAPFAVGRYEVTFDEYDVCVQAARCPAVSSAPGAVIYNGIRHRAPDGGWGRGRRPVISVSYADATLYVEWLSEITGESYSVPTESQWEYVARAGTQAQWNTGANLTADDANILSSGFDKTVAVGGYPPNSYGLYDTIGNVWEWTQDCLDTGYVGVPADGSPATQGNCATTGIVRGGSFGSEIDGARSASRFPFGHANRALSVGFRVVRSL